MTPATSVSFTSGESSKLFAVSTIEDSLVEADESFTLILSSTLSSVSFADSSATLTILNDDSSSSTNIVQNYTYNINNSKNYTINIGGDVNISNTENNIRVDYKFVGTSS